MALAEPGDRVLASGELHAIGELCELAFAACGLDWRAHVTSSRPPGDRPAVVGDPARAARELGWVRRRPFATWIAEMVAADRERIESE
jgi:GDPmannose 4,6-dehydratase